MIKRFALLFCLLATPAFAQTINNLGAGAAVQGTDLFPTYQGANPAKRVSATQLATFTNAAIPTACATAGGVFYKSGSALACASGFTTDGLSLTLTGGSVKASAPLINGTQTWNNAGVTFALDTMNVTNTASGATSTIFNRSVGGVSQFSVGVTGAVIAASSFSPTNNIVAMRTSGFKVASTGTIAFQSTATAFGTDDTILTRKAAATLQLGSFDAAAPVAQSLGVQSVVAGTSNTAGANWTQRGSVSTGSGVSGDIIFQTGGTGAAATAQNAFVTALTIKGATQAVRASGTLGTGGYIVSALPVGGVAGDRAYVTDQLTACAVTGAALTGGGAVVCPAFYNGSAWVGG